MKTDREHRLALFPFRSFGLASLYGFVSGIFLGLGLNLFVSVFLAKDLRAGEKAALFGAAFAFMVSSSGVFIVHWNLQIARDEWIAEGASQNPKLIVEPIEARLRRLYVGLVIGLTGIVVGMYLIASRSLPFLNLE
ncbi:MAG TPA: hypothetical protein VFI57_06585 [Pyrinomonadaceae bacterium]|nr:hypothetical protein [Pyrinomonadaceae bacterium]